MTDPMDQLRQANPEHPQNLDLDPLRARVQERLAPTTPTRRAPTRSRLAPALTAAIALTGVLVLVLALNPGRSPVDLAARAYAATSDVGIVHWQISTDTVVDGRRRTHQREREQGWAGNGITHTLLSTGHGAQITVTERRVTGGRQQVRVDRGTISTGPAGGTDLARVLPGRDPFLAFRRAYREHRLVPLPGHRYRVRMPATRGNAHLSLVYELDPVTAEPRLLMQTRRTSGTRMVSTTHFEKYERLPLTAGTAELLKLRP